MIMTSLNNGIPPAGRILVTGSEGLIGGWVCKTLREQGYLVFGLDSNFTPETASSQSIRCDIIDRTELLNVFRDLCPVGVVHLAARTDLNETRDLTGYRANTDGVSNLLAAVSETSSVERVIVTSSQLVCRLGHVPRDPQDFCPTTLYGQSKVLTEQITREMDGGGRTWCITRPTTVWGPGMSPHYQSMLRLIRRGFYFHCGRSKLLKSYAYAGNIAFQYWKLLTAPSDQIHRRLFYLADYEPLSLREYTKGLAKAMNAPSIRTLPIPFARGLAWVGDALNLFGLSSFPFNSFRLGNILNEYRCDTDPIREISGDLPFSFADGVEATAEWFLKKEELEREKSV